MVVAELAHLLVGDLGEPLRAEAERGAPQAGDQLDVVVPGIVEHAAAFAARNDQRAVRLVRRRLVCMCTRLAMSRAAIEFGM